MVAGWWTKRVAGRLSASRASNEGTARGLSPALDRGSYSVRLGATNQYTVLISVALTGHFRTLLTYSDNLNLWCSIEDGSSSSV